ncbi:hypothetical protein [Gluconacetobacter johannae]|uniref:Uncharacterized protein n=1 Tax=Gluconacetobacter johannae TaxID=112140 RepID=A0A7W4J8S8_9PROT|nr:hypothetical protein [Gluconacetobacter johannae]MBB2176552.1 hypothetical protein [Gluconacetobacter johannae]
MTGTDQTARFPDTQGLIKAPRVAGRERIINGRLPADLYGGKNIENRARADATSLALFQQLDKHALVLTSGWITGRWRLIPSCHAGKLRSPCRRMWEELSVAKDAST